MMANHSCSIIVNGNHTDIIVNIYRNKVFLILSQYRKLGSVLRVTKEISVKDFSSTTYTIKTIFGIDDINTHVAARYICEHINTDSPLLLSVCLKSYDVETLKQIVKAINQINY